MDLYQNANSSDSGIATLYIGPAVMSGIVNLSTIVSNITPPTIGQATIFLSNEDKQGINLFLQMPEFSDVSLYCMGPVIDSSAQDIILKTVDLIEDFAQISINGGNVSDSYAEIFLENYPDNLTKSVLPLFIGKDIETNSLNTELFIRGSLGAGSFYEESALDIIMETSPLRPEENISIVIFSDLSGASSDSLPLKIHNEPESGFSSDNLILTIPTTSGSSVFYSGISRDRNLTIKGAGIESDNTTLFLKRIGGGGGEEFVGSVSFYVHNNNTSSGVTIIIDGVNGTSENMNMSIPKTTGLLNKNINQFIRGYEE
jgi:hypothetical protein